MGHTPHLLLDPPWDDERIALNADQQHHVFTVLKRTSGGPVTYTDGKGMVGNGVLEARRTVIRGEERQTDQPPLLDMAVAPPASRDRVRFVVEKLAEIGVSRLLWLKTEHGANRPPSAEKAVAWARAALEQSRGSWLMSVSDGLVGWDDLEQPIAVCEQSGGQPDFPPRTVVIGPEGGFGEGEIPPNAPTWGLVPSVLRVETAAVVAAALARGNQPG